MQISPGPIIRNPLRIMQMKNSPGTNPTSPLDTSIPLQLPIWCRVPCLHLSAKLVPAVDPYIHPAATAHCHPNRPIWPFVPAALNSIPPSASCRRTSHPLGVGGKRQRHSIPSCCETELVVYAPFCCLFVYNEVGLVVARNRYDSFGRWGSC